MAISSLPQPVFKSYIVAAVTTVLTYDWMCTLDEEVAYVWSRPWSLGTCLFILNRYLPVVDVTLSIILTWTASTPEICRRHHVMLTCFVSSGMLLSEMILILRTYAIWNGKRSVFVCLFCVAVCTLSTFVTVLAVGTSALKYGPAKGARPGCNIIKANDITVFYYLTVLVSETIIVTLTVVKAIQHRGSRSSWVLQLSRDGLVFYVFMLGITSANVALTLNATSPRYKNVLALPQRAFHSIFCNRVILLILGQRATYARDNRLPLRAGGFSMNNSEVLSSVVETYDATDSSATFYHPDWTR